MKFTSDRCTHLDLTVMCIGRPHSAARVTNWYTIFMYITVTHWHTELSCPSHTSAQYSHISQSHIGTPHSDVTVTHRHAKLGCQSVTGHRMTSTDCHVLIHETSPGHVVWTRIYDGEPVAGFIITRIGRNNADTQTGNCGAIYRKWIASYIQPEDGSVHRRCSD